MWRWTWINLLVTADTRFHLFVSQRLLVQRRRAPVAGELPGGDVHVMLVVPLGLAVRELVLLAEMAAARFIAFERVQAQQLRELEEIGDAPGSLQRLVQFRPGTGHH